MNVGSRENISVRPFVHSASLSTHTRILDNDLMHTDGHPLFTLTFTNAMTHSAHNFITGL